MKLTDSIIKAAKPKDKCYNLPDGKGLVLLVQPDGQKAWRFRYYFSDKEKMLSIGFYPVVRWQQQDKNTPASKNCWHKA